MDEGTNAITCNIGSASYNLQVGASGFFKDGEVITLSAPISIENNIIMAPIDFFSSAFSMQTGIVEDGQVGLIRWNEDVCQIKVAGHGLRMRLTLQLNTILTGRVNLKKKIHPQNI